MKWRIYFISAFPENSILHLKKSTIMSLHKKLYLISTFILQNFI